MRQENQKKNLKFKNKEKNKNNTKEIKQTSIQTLKYSN